MINFRLSSTLAGAVLLLPALALGTGCDEGDASVRFNLPPLDVETPALPDALSTGGGFGEDCIVSEDCLSGFCSPAAEGGVCTDLCEGGDGGSCADGFACESLTVNDTEVAICVAVSALTCQPCTDDAQCNLPGLSGNSCLDYGDDGSFCGLACADDDACPDGFGCDAGQCRKSDGEGTCDCNAAGNSLAMATACSVTNQFGTCEGARMCSTSGLSQCDAPAPALEACNGLDDNCDGATDEGTSGGECEIVNDFGTCIGAVECTEGDPICVGRAASAEICDGIDNDCDGVTDEDQADLDQDGIPNCTDDDIDGDGSLNDDDCKPYNPAIHPGAAETCNGIDDNCNVAIDEGTDRSDQDECDAYICAGPEGCRDDCYGNVHCTTGYKCDLGDDNDNGDSNECLPSVCGNGDLEIQEVCDDGTNDGGYGGCMPGCQALGPRCGDGRRDVGDELCDEGEANGQPNHCNLTCDGITPSDCGNGVIEAGELCDNGSGEGGNSDSPDSTCRTDCRPQRCGDGVVDTQAGEVCDAGNANDATTCGCQSSCTFAPSATPCRSSEGFCDVAESCSGAGSCPMDTFKDSETTCRGADGLCDAVEYCTGSAAQCPSDAKMDSETTCRPASEGGCDVAEYCTGDNDDCPADAIATAGAVCNPSVGLCDIAEVCDGDTKLCPDDVVMKENIVCRDPAGLCDVAERCDGQSGVCPDDNIAESGVICRESAGDCDSAEACDGLAAQCPDDVVASAQTLCRPAELGCDLAEYCDGETGGCPTDSFKDAGVVCNDSVGSCDPAETCSGATPECPQDFVEEAGTPCPVGDGNCDNGICECTDDAQCEQLCGNGRIDAHVGETCEPGEDGVTGAQDRCNDTCVGYCDADATWARHDGGEGDESATDVAVNGSGTSWVVGHFRSGEQLAGPSLNVPALGGAAFGDTWMPATYERQGFVMVTGKDNAPMWAACIGAESYASGGIEPTGVATDRHDNAFVVGHFGEAVSFGCCGGGDGQEGLGLCPSFLSECEGRCGDVFLSKWDNQGNVVWATTGGDPYDDNTFIHEVGTTADGKAVVVGVGNDDIFWDDLLIEKPRPFYGNQPSVARISDNDALVISFNRHGQPGWGKLFGGLGQDGLYGVALDGAGDIYVSGRTGDGNITIDGTNYGHPDGGLDNGNNGSSDFSDPINHGGAFIAKISADGAPQWATIIESDNDALFGDVVVAGDGSVYAVGAFAGHLAWADTNSTADHGIFVTKFDAGGGLDWLALATSRSGYGSYGGELNSIDLEVDRRGRVTVAGDLSGHWAFGDHNVTSTPGDGAAARSPFIARVDTDGSWLWAKGYTGDQGQNAGFTGMDIDPYGGVWVTGSFDGNLTIDDTNLTSYAPSYGGQYYSKPDVLLARLLPDGNGCEQCGDGIVGPGESCDDGGDSNHCEGACDGICSGPANGCGDGWVECGEDYDLGGGSADLGMCMIPVGATWCFQADDNTFTLLPTNPGGMAAMSGPGTLSHDEAVVFGGNPMGPDACPVVADPKSVGARQWGGDMPNPSPDSTGRRFCDGDTMTPPSVSSSDATNDEAAAMECGDYYEFVANTGADVAFEFDERAVTQGPTNWSVWVSLSGAEGSWEKVLEGATTDVGASDFGDGVDSPMHTAYLTDAATAEGMIANQSGVQFRIYAWGALATDAPFVVDNVRVGPPRTPEPVNVDPSLIISEIVDGTLSGGTPKFFEITNVGAGPANLMDYSVGRYANGSSTLGNSTPLPDRVLNVGESFVVASESTVFTATYGFAPDLVGGVANNNGDDVVALFTADGVLLDVMGVIGVDGNGEPWEYQDGWAVRNPNVTVGSATFAAAEWIFSGANAMDGEDAAAHKAVNSPGVHAYTPAP